MEVYAFCQHIACYNNIKLVQLFFTIVCVEVGGYSFTLLVSVFSGNTQYICTPQTLGHSTIKTIYSIYAFAEDDKFMILVFPRIEQLALQHIDKQLQLGIVIDRIPFVTQCFKLSCILPKHIKKYWLEISRMIDKVFALNTFTFNVLNNIVQIHLFLHLKLFHIVFRGDKHLVGDKHVNHTCGNVEERMEGLLKCLETTFQTFHHVGAENTGKQQCHMFTLFAFIWHSWSEKLDGTIACIMHTCSFRIIFRWCIC